MPLNRQNQTQFSFKAKILEFYYFMWRIVQSKPILLGIIYYQTQHTRTQCTYLCCLSSPIALSVLWRGPRIYIFFRFL